MWNTIMAIILTIALIMPITSYCLVNQEYHYHTYKPSPWPEMGIAIDSNNNVHIVWNFPQILDGGHNMVGIWYMKLDNCGNILKGKQRIVDDLTDDPKIAIDINDNIHIIWFTGYPEKGMYYLFDSRFTKLNEYNLKVFYDNKTAIENLYLNDFHHQFNNFTSGIPLRNDYNLKGEKPVYAIDYNNDTHIVSVSDDGYYSKLDSNGKILIKNLKLNCIPDCVSIHTTLKIILGGIFLNICVAVIWSLGIKRIKKRF